MNNLSDSATFKDGDTVRVDNIERVFLNDTPASGLNLTLLVRGGNNELVPCHGFFSRFHKGAFAEDNIPRIFADVEPNQPMWAKVTRIVESSCLVKEYRYTIELHVRDGSDIDGGDWSRTDPNPPYTRHTGKVQPIA